MRQKAALALLICTLPASAAIWPERFAGTNRTAVKPLAVPASERAIWEEYGFDEAEQATYGDWSAQAWRLKDSTGAAAAFQWQRPEGAKPWTIKGVSTSGLSVEAGKVGLLAFGNYLLRLDGKKPTAEDLGPFFHQLPKLDQSALPPLLAFLPSENLIPNSERYILGPPSLEKFRPGLPPATVAFHMGAEGQISRFKEPHGELELCLFYYPSPQIARDRLNEFQKISGAMVKRAGPLVALVLNPSDRDDAERLLARINYKATVTWSEPAPGSQLRNMGSLLLNIVVFCGILLFFCLVGGLAVGGVRIFGGKFGRKKAEEEPMTLLHLEDRQDAS